MKKDLYDGSDTGGDGHEAYSTKQMKQKRAKKSMTERNGKNRMMKEETK